jgi:hypothetical protein
MSVTIKVNGTVNSLVHKGSNHFSAATIPDVCKTPSPAGPVPIPYPNVTMSDSLDKGSTTVKADGGNMIAIKGSEFSMSQGDEPGTVGGLKSSTFKKESTWILYSFDVKIEGKGACRLTDKKFQNHENTVDIMGAGGAPVKVADLSACTAEALQTLADDCNKLINCDKKKGGPCPERSPSGPECSTLGTKKHKCCEKAIKNFKTNDTTPRNWFVSEPYRATYSPSFSRLSVTSRTS